jgi:primary-amine oxidase
MAPHPLDSLSVEETSRARDGILKAYPNVLIDFREIYLQEPAKEELKAFLTAEHRDQLSPSTPRPARLAKCQYDVIGSDKIPEYHESIVDISTQKVITRKIGDKKQHASLTLYVHLPCSERRTSLLTNC